MRTLLKAGAAVDKSSAGITPLSLAARKGHLEVVKVLLAAGADVRATDKMFGATPLLWAAREGDVASVDALLAAGADLFAVNQDRRNLFLLAAEGSNTSVLKRLLVLGANPIPPCVTDRRARSDSVESTAASFPEVSKMAKKTTTKKTTAKKITVRDLRPAKAGKVKGGSYDWAKNVKL